MKVYFSGALFSQQEFQPRYEKMVKYLKSVGHEVLENTLVTPYTKFQHSSEKDIKHYFDESIKWIGMCDIAVFEVSFPSTLSIGYEMSVALGKGKPVVAMYLEERDPKFLLNVKDKMVIWSKYGDGDIEGVLKKAIDEAVKKAVVRLNMFLPKSLMSYLDSATKNTGMNKSEYVRGLIEKAVGGKR